MKRLLQRWELLFFSLLALSLGSCSKPLASFMYQGKKQVLEAIQFENNSSNYDSCYWDFGDGIQSKEVSPNHIYKASGNYLVTLTVQKKKKQRSMEKRVVIDPPKACLVEMETDYGTMLIELSNATPQHQENFLKLAEEGYYDDLLFHRVIDGFMIQGGDPESRNAVKGQSLGRGGPGYTVPAEFIDTLIHVKGALSAARTGDAVNPERRSSGSQFFIVHGGEVNDDQLNQTEARKDFRYSKDQRDLYKEQGGTPFLDRDYTVFGQVIKGLEVIDKIAKVRKSRGDRPVEDVKMKVRVIK